MIKILTQDKDFFPKTFPEKFRYLREMGFDGFEIDGKHLLNDLQTVRQAIQTTVFPVLTCCGGYEGWIGDFDEDRRQQAIRQISILLQNISDIGGKGVVVPAAWGMFSLRLPPMVPPRSAGEDEVILLDSLRHLDQTAKHSGVNLYLEPLNRYEDHMINTVSKAQEYIEKGSFSNVSVIADFYHMNIEEARIEETIVNFGKNIQHVHLADSHRFQPGSGHIDFEKGFRALRQANYNGTMAFECRVTGEHAEDMYKDSLLYIKKLCAKVWESKTNSIKN